MEEEELARLSHLVELEFSLFGGELLRRWLFVQGCFSTRSMEVVSDLVYFSSILPKSCVSFGLTHFGSRCAGIGAIKEGKERFD